MTASSLTQAGALSIIIPTLNEAACLPDTLRAIGTALPRATIHVADGGSLDATPSIAAACGARLVHAPRGRGPQLAAGANAATTPWLLFLHADTRLPADAGPALDRFVAAGRSPVGTFHLRFDTPGVLLGCCARLAAIDSVFTRFGDQGVVTSREAYDALGGWPPWPLFEDVEFLRRARRRYGRVARVPGIVTTSARRFRKLGVLRQQGRNTRLLVRFLLGASPERLAAEYGAIRDQDNKRARRAER